LIRKKKERKRLRRLIQWNKKIKKRNNRKKKNFIQNNYERCDWFNVKNVRGTLALKSIRTHKSYFCWDGGFSSNSTLIEGTPIQKDYESTLPQLYVDFRFVDDEKKVWYPATINSSRKRL